MTEEQLKAWVETDCDNADVAQRILALLAKEAARGEVFPCCTFCDSGDIQERPEASWLWVCRSCDGLFMEPNCLQRIPAPEAKD